MLSTQMLKVVGLAVGTALTRTLRLLVPAHCPGSGVKVSPLEPVLAVAGLNVLPDTPGPDQVPVMPLWVVLRGTEASFAQNGPMGARAGVVAPFTVTIIVLALAHCPAVGVNVKVWLPAPAEAGLKLLPATPGPDQVPFMPLWVAFKGTAASVLQSGPTGFKAGVVAEFTVTGSVLARAHCPAAGVKVRVWLPAPAVAGLKLLPDTPGPDQAPDMPLCVVFSGTAASLMQNGPTDVNAGDVALVTFTINVLTEAHCPALGVNVRVWLPAPAVAGLNVLPDTPGPDQIPVIPLWVVFRGTAASVEQSGPIGGSPGEVALVTLTIIVFTSAHCPASGVKVRVWMPAPAVAGLKIFPETPGPDQVPVIPLWVVFSGTAASVEQKGPILVSVGAVGVLIVMVKDSSSLQEEVGS